MKGEQAFQEAATEEARQDTHGQKRSRACRRDPAFAVRRQAAAGDDDVDVRMVSERRSPSVQHAGESDLTPSRFGSTAIVVSVSAAVLHEQVGRAPPCFGKRLRRSPPAVVNDVIIGERQ